MGFMYRMATDREFRRAELEEGKKVAREHADAVHREREEKRQAKEAKQRADEAHAAARKAGYKR